MRFGMLHLFENPIGKSEHEIIHEQIALMRAAEDLGFDSVWPAEHHFTEYGDFRDAVIWYYRTIAKYVAPKQGEDAVQEPTNPPPASSA